MKEIKKKYTVELTPLQLLNVYRAIECVQEEGLYFNTTEEFRQTHEVKRIVGQVLGAESEDELEEMLEAIGERYEEFI